jgi:cholesterol oxidase
MNSNCDTNQKVPAYIPVANEYTRRLAEKIDGDPAATITEIFLNTSTTAHIMGGCVMADCPENGVIDHKGQIFGYKNLYVADGSIVPANLGVNPSLTITAMAEYILDQVPEKI